MSTDVAVKTPVLVIEDEPSVLSFVKAALERAGYSVAPVATGAEALTKLKSDNYLGVVSDMRTPGGVDGADVHAWISANKPELSSRVIFITGDIVNDETAATLRRTGAPCVEKPFRVRQLLEIVKRVFGNPQ
jgi:DNA-binding NtrC family response regulator